MGGGIAARFAQLYPERPLSVAILDSNTAAAQPVSASAAETRERTASLCAAGDMQAAATYFLANNPAYRLFAGDTAENRERVHDMIATTNPVGFANTLRAMLKPDSTPEDLERIVAPTLVMAGELDPAMAAIRATHERIPGARLVLVPGAGHLSNIDAPDAFVKTLQDFFCEVA